MLHFANSFVYVVCMVDFSFVFYFIYRTQKDSQLIDLGRINPSQKPKINKLATLFGMHFVASQVDGAASFLFLGTMFFAPVAFFFNRLYN